MARLRHSWMTPHAEVRPAGGKGQGVFATAEIPAGEIVAAFGGYMMSSAEFTTLPVEHQVHSLQVAEDLFLACPTQAEPADFFNHSCAPNLGIAGSVMLITMSVVRPGDELTFDYAMCDADSYDEFECQCGADACRRKVTGNDWMLPDLQDRYLGYFSTYLERRIAQLRSGPGAERLL